MAAWLTESWMYEEGIAGLISGLDLSRELLTDSGIRFIPEMDEGDAEPRSAKLDWLGSYFDPAKGSSPIIAVSKQA